MTKPPAFSNDASLIERLTGIAIFVTVLLVAFGLVWPFAAPRAGPGQPTYVEVSQWLSGFVQPLAVFWFVWAYLLQREEFKLQRRELEQTRLEVSRQAESLASSELTQKRALFMSLRPLYEDRLSQLVQPSLGWFQYFATPWSHSGSNPIFSMSNVICGVLKSGATNGLSPEMLREHFFETSCIERSHRYKSTMDELLERAEDCRGDGVFVDVVRSSEFFAWYKGLVEMYGLETHRLADGRGPGDCILPNWTELAPLFSGLRREGKH